MAYAVPGTPQVAPGATTQGASTKSKFYRPELDAVRFVLFLGVFINHGMNHTQSALFAKIPWLELCVRSFHDLCGFSLSFFFFLSAYLITCLLQIEKHRTGTVHLAKFYSRRLLRLWPLYIGFILLIALLGLGNRDLAMSRGAVVAMLLFVGNWYAIFHLGFPSPVVNHLWSISVEEQFYLLFPSLTRRFSNARMQQLCGLVCAVSLATTWLLVHKGAGLNRVWLDSLVQSIFFAGGALYGFHDSLREHAKSAKGALLGIAAGVALWAVAQAGNVTSLTRPMHPFTATMAYALAALGCACILRGVLKVPLSWVPRWLVYLGRVAYGLYVFHALVIYGVQKYLAPHIRVPGLGLLLELLLTIAIAVLSYEFYEKPFLRIKHKFELVHSRTA
ncbi:acyltransferase [Acidipila sp. EB88]|uniref:acyltransferase family protein n=1 Tax=Acidipila sp. EB88 TaxID=2305226 RepID=UPI000F603180|nr:acyltransferase [Acidipila sp. EB88]RRA47976.1 acyltransferase [Acidipila sp. EB88]